MKQPFLPSSATEKQAQLAPKDAMADAAGAESRPMTRGKEFRLPLAALNNKERGLRAAIQVLQDGLSPKSARTKWLVDADCLRYYKNKLEERGAGSGGSSRSGSGGGVATSESGVSSGVVQSSTLSNKRSAWNDYQHAYVYAGQLVKEGKNCTVAARLAAGKFGVSISRTTAARAAKKPGEPPVKPGKPLIIPDWVERRLEHLCNALRELHMPIFRSMIISYANTLINGTAIQEKLKHRELRRHWYYAWLGRCQTGLHTGNIRPLELTRAQWATPENLEHHYAQLAEMMIGLGIAVANPSFDPKKPYDEMVKIVKPGRLFSMDETRLTNDTMEAHKGKANRSILSKGDDGTTIVNKGGGDGTGIGGSTADGLDLPGFFIFANDIIHAGEQDCDVAKEVRPQCRRLDPAKPGQLLECKFWANAKGWITGDLGVPYIRGCVEPSIPDLSPSSPAIIIMDGHGSHFTLELLLYCREIGLHILLRPPHTTHILQGEDVQHFAVFKPAYHQAKLLKIHERALCGEYKLRCSDLLGCAKAPWERAFNLENTLKAWEKTGLSPFTRSVYWDLKAKEEERAAVAAVAEVNPELLTVHGMVRCMFPKAAAAADAETERQAAESAQGPGKTKKRKDPDARLNSSHLWHLPGGATGDECLAIVKEKTEARKAKELKTKEGKEKRAKAKKDRLSAANSLGSTTMAKLKCQQEVSKLTVPMLTACLVFKSVSIPNGSKKADLVALLLKEVDLPVNPPSEPEPSDEPDEPDVLGDAGSDGEDGEESDRDGEGALDSKSEDEGDMIL